jgi:hypothetical protein
MTLLGKSKRQPQGKSSTKASSQRKKFKVIGGTISATTLPKIELPAQTKGGSSSKPMVAGVKSGAGAGAGVLSDMRVTL